MSAATSSTQKPVQNSVQPNPLPESEIPKTDEKINDIAPSQIEEHTKQEKKDEFSLGEKFFSPNTKMPSSEQRSHIRNGALAGFGLGMVAVGTGYYKGDNRISSGGLATIIGSLAIDVWSSFYREKINYQNPMDLKESRDLAQKTDLAETVKLHGWENIFNHRVLEPAAFREKFIAYKEKASLNDLISFYRDAKVTLDSVKETNPECEYEIPDAPNWSDLFEKEASDLNLSDIVKKYHLQPYYKEVLTNNPFLLTKAMEYFEIVEKVNIQPKAAVDWEGVALADHPLFYNDIVLPQDSIHTVPLKILAGTPIFKKAVLKKLDSFDFYHLVNELDFERLRYVGFKPNDRFLYEKRELLENKRHIEEQYTIRKTRPLTEKEVKGGRTMESKGKDALNNRNAELEILEIKANQLKSDYLMDLASALPKSA